ncbi:DUF3626 domain-containing protein [Ornithinibacillus halotolerans]|uniref:DUF3626 domain-containing protein n=1 Tax=Ornithinibacillus halotolerans TaxID=1274357 RepID=A0A916S493_9BACI|nr:DUF3626 domain-containing protein [Ornithinibacillus halotolerans]GGA80387.1 hypothetical protein GCM10008025_24730 [Ornithinibacillus halotolerans]
MNLSKPQQMAMEHFTNYAKNHQQQAIATIHHILKMSNISVSTYEKAVNNLKGKARIGLHFHPDRLDNTMKTVAESLLDQGVYKSQFETLISNGSVSAYPGGHRDNWEKRLFGGAYQIEGTKNSERPKYGALQILPHADGPAPRFGSCYFLLSPKVSTRSTFTYLDSHQDPKEKGTYEAFEMIMATLLADSFQSECAIGERNLTPPRLIQHLLKTIDLPMSEQVVQKPSRNLNHYVEAQIHGDISLQDDVEILVADPSFQGTPIGSLLEKIAQTYSIDLYWHQGFTLSVDEVPTDFRGPTMPSLAKRIANNNDINAQLIGSAVLDLYQNPKNWEDRGTHQEVLQELKLLWHVLVRYGK